MNAAYTRSTYRRQAHSPRYWIHMLVIFSLYCAVSEIDYRELTDRVSHSQAAK